MTIVIIIFCACLQQSASNKSCGIASLSHSAPICQCQPLYATFAACYAMSVARSNPGLVALTFHFSCYSFALIIDAFPVLQCVYNQ